MESNRSVISWVLPTMNTIKYCVLSDVPPLDKQLPFKNQWLNLCWNLRLQIYNDCLFVFFFLFHMATRIAMSVDPRVMTGK
jgi:hypothetical protein